MSNRRKPMLMVRSWCEALEPRVLLSSGGTGVDDVPVIVETLPLVDLQAESVSTNLPATAVVGDVGKAKLTVSNQGEMSLSGRRVDIEIYATTSGQIDGSAVLLGQRQNVMLYLPADPAVTRDLYVNIAITEELDVGSYTVVAKVTLQSSDNEPADSILFNNEVADATPLVVENAFGGFTGRTGVNLTLTQDDGTLVTFSFQGDAGGRVFRGDGYFDIVITRAGPNAALMLKSVKGPGGAGSGIAVIRNISFLNADSQLVADSELVQPAAVDPQLMLGKFLAKTARLIGQFAAAGGVKFVQLAEADGATISISDSGVVGDTVTLNILQARNLSIVSALPIKSLSTARWLDDDGSADAIEAPSLGTLKVTGNKALGLTGDFQADLDLSGSLTAAQINGGLSGATWTIAGGATRLRVLGASDADVSFGGTVKLIAAGSWLSGSIAAASLTALQITGGFAADLTLTSNAAALGRATIVGAVSGGNWSIAGNSGSIRAAGISDLDLRSAGSVASITTASIDDSLIFLGVDGNDDDLPLSVNDFSNANAMLGRLTVTGAGASFSNSLVAAPVLGAVLLREVDTDNGGQTFGFAAASVGALTRLVDGAALRLVALDAAQESVQDGDFVARIVS